MSKYIFNNDTDILEFLEQLRENGIQIWGEGEKIRYRSKNRQLAPETLRILKMAKGQILDFFRMIEKNVIPLTSIQTAYVVGQTAGCELGNINAHYYIEYTIESLDVERLEQMINLVISKNDALRLIVTHEGKASFLDNVPYYSVPVYSLYDGNDREQKRLERSHHRYNYYKWPMFHFCVGKTSGKTSVLHVDFDCIILDAWSAKLLLNEIFSLYYGKDVKFPRISFMNYMRLKTDKGDLEAEEYWKEKVKNMPSFPKLNYQKKFAEVQNVRFDRIECDFSFIETQRLYQKIKNYHFTPAAVISTIFMKTLAQYSETPGLSINVTLFNRQLLHEDVNGILGEFTNNAVISYQEKTDSLLDAIRATQEQMWRLVQYRKFEGSNILKMLSSGRAGKAIMPVVFTCMLEGNVSKVTKKRYSFKEEYAISQTPQVVLDHHVRDDLGYLKISYAEVISRWSSNKHFTLNLPIQNRPTIGNNTNSIVGDFTAVNLLEVNVTQNMSFIERVKEITKRLMEDLEHNSFSGVEVLRELSKVSEEKELLMPIVFTGVLKTDGTVGTIEYGFSHTPQVWIDCQIVDEIDSEDQEKGLMISWDTRKGAIKESIVTEMFESFTETIRILGIKHSEEWKNPLEIIVPSASKKKVICERNKGITNQSRIQQRFVKYAKKNSNKTAVIDAVETVTYGELLERAEYIAGYLRKEFVENRTGLVAIRMKKSVNQIAAVMGVLIAGFSYLPIDIKQPLARQEKILSKANVIVELDEKKVNMILQNLEYRLEKHPEFQNPIAYVIFTSGSTGEPKGVVMSHTAAQNTLISIENMYNISEEDTILGIAELSFDLSVFDIFSVLGVGGTLVLPNPEKGPDASHWGRLLNEYKVTLWNSVPAQAEMLDAFASKSESYPTVRLVLLSGDWINTSLPGRLRKIMTNAQMISLGGATEGGIWSIYHEIDEIEERPTILYGKALLGQWMGVVDEELRICPEYVSGQIAIGGYSLAEGYLGDTTLTKEKFVYVEEEKNRIYLTGDNGRYVENGDIEFLGRLDNQVKINGHRIEIAEIENAIRGMQNIEDCCVVYNQSIGKGVLIAFIKNKISSISYTKEEYRKQLAFFLPPAMIPSEFVNVERFPLSTNGKIDRKGLAESIQKNIKVKHNAKATLISQKKEYVELAKSIKKIVCSISGNDYIDYEDNLLENGLDSLLLSQISGRIVSDIQEAQGMRFDEILRASLTMPTIMGIAQYISDCKNPSKNQMHSNAGNQTRNSYTVVYIFGDNENEIRDVLIEKLSASNISCKRVGGQEIIERCHEDISVKKKYIIAFSEMASLCITKASELLGENIIINRIFLINPSKAKESDLYLGDISIIDGNSVAIKSWEKAVLGNVREFESNSNDIFDIIMRELENDK
jgi:pyochelin synthetase